MLKYAPHVRLDLRSHAEFNEAWVQDRIAENPAILGLGDLTLVERERRQSRAGRLDLLLSDSEQTRRYEIELMLGPTDPDHLIRVIEYWDIERRRYPAYDHVAVLVAEDITSRFLNVLALFSGSIPLVAIQLSALSVGESVVLNFVRVLDQIALRTDDSVEVATETVDRDYWKSRSSAEVLSIADAILQSILAKGSRQYQLNYNRQFIGLKDGNRSRNFVSFTPRRRFCWVKVNVAEPLHWVKRFDEAGLDASENRGGKLTIQTTPEGLRDNQALFDELMHAAVTEYED